jgi:Leucine-rich repeat (LRR) protein
VSLIGLDCCYNCLTSLPKLPLSLTNLYCSGNQLMPASI